MLELKNIVKDYTSKSNKDLLVHAVKGISITFRENEFVSILGPSGCGKTTTLNIIGGLDRYTSGDLLIDNISTKEYKDKDWDRYRNHRVGFVFQSYNLIPHQTILSNVELALTIGNVAKEKRKEMAIEALTKVGLKDEIYKKPNQLSGGQMQRVAIARAIVNKPSIILADEPTGALDSKTSRQVLNILKELSKDCLIVMVTHNEELANEYSSRIISLKDGLITGDTNPYNKEENEKTNLKNIDIKNKKRNKVGMNFFTSLKLSLDNLKSKLGRTILTSFAGSIGIIGIALILSVSSGFNNYIKKVESNTLSEYPVSIGESSVDYTSLLAGFMTQDTGKSEENDTGMVIPNYIMVDFLKTLASSANSNDLKSFKEYIEANEELIDPYVRNISYSYNVSLNIYRTYLENNNFVCKSVLPFNLPDTDSEGKTVYMKFNGVRFPASTMERLMSNVEVWSELYDNIGILSEQYNLVSGSWPTKFNEVIIKVDENDRISDFAVYAMGLAKDGDDYVTDLFKYVSGELEEDPSSKYVDKYKYTYDELLQTEFYVIPKSQYYVEDDREDIKHTFSSILGDDDKIKEYLEQYESYTFEDFSSDTYEGPIKLKVVGIVKENPSSDTHSISGSIGYTSDLIKKIYTINNISKVVKMQNENPDYPVIDYTSMVGMMYKTVNKGTLWSDTNLTSEQIETALNYIKNTSLGYVDESKPSSINLYPNNFEDKDEIIEFINKYNNSLSEEDAHSKRITYNDYLGSMIGGVTTIVNAITYVLIGFVSVSLIVSSIMIAVITRISVMERTKEIGILRAMGASKIDVKRIFNAETFITGLISGLLGVGITLLLNIPICMIVKSLADIENIAILPVNGAISLVIISFVLTVISGLIPASYAAKCDPVIALRSE